MTGGDMKKLTLAALLAMFCAGAADAQSAPRPSAQTPVVTPAQPPAPAQPRPTTPLVVSSGIPAPTIAPPEENLATPTPAEGAGYSLPQEPESAYSPPQDAESKYSPPND